MFISRRNSEFWKVKLGESEADPGHLSVKELTLATGQALNWWGVTPVGGQRISYRGEI